MMKRIMVVDDNEMNMEIMSTILSESGYLVTEAKDGYEALAKIDSIDDLALVLLDILMPGISGYEVASEIRKKGISVPILASTANAFLEDKQKIVECGIDGWLIKPIKMSVLIETVEGYIGKP